MDLEKWLEVAPEKEKKFISGQLDEWSLHSGKVIYKNKRKTTSPDLNKAYGDLVAATGSPLNLLDYEQLVKDLLESFQKMEAEDFPEDYEITEYDRLFIADFRFFIDENFQRVVLFRSGQVAETYKLVGAQGGGKGTKGFEEALVSAGSYKKLKELYFETCKKLAKEKKLQGNICGVKQDVTGSGKMTAVPLQFREYLRKVMEVFLTDISFRIAIPKTISNNPLEPAFYHFDPEKLQPGACPDWDGWLMAMPECCRAVFRAWFYSVFDAYNSGRQACWIKSEGYDGKSRMQQATARYTGYVGVGALSKDALNNQFGFSKIFDKRLLVYGDCKNPKLIHSEKIHSILGGDVVNVERKNEQSFTAKVHAKVLIGANCAPEINTNCRNEITRIIYIPMVNPPKEIMAKYCLTDEHGEIQYTKFGVPKFSGYPLEEKLYEQMDAFLYQCKQDYEQLCPNRGDIIVPDDMLELLYNECGAPEEVLIEDYIQKHLLVTGHPQLSTNSYDLRKHFLARTESNDLVYGQLCRTLSQRGAKQVRRRVGNSRVRVWEGVRIINPYPTVAMPAGDTDE